MAKGSGKATSAKSTKTPVYDEVKTSDGVDKSEGIKEEAPDVTPEDADDEVVSIAVEYINPEAGLTTREFSLAVHGKEFKDKAKAFAEKFSGTIL